MNRVVAQRVWYKRVNKKDETGLTPLNPACSNQGMLMLAGLVLPL